MYNFKSGEGVKIGDCEVQVLMSKKTESHKLIREEHGICEDRGPIDGAHTPITLHPVRGIDPNKPELWELEFAADRPDWWTDDMTAQATRQMLAFVAEHHLHGGEFHHAGHVYLKRLATWPPNTAFQSGGDAEMPSVTAWGAGSPLHCGGGAYLPSLTTWGPGSPFHCGGGANLRSLAACPHGTLLECVGLVWDGERWQAPDKWLREHTARASV